MKDEINSITQTEERMYELFSRMTSAITPEEKRAIRIKLRALEKKHDSILDDDTKEYPQRLKGLPDDEPMNKTELLKLIDSVPDYEFDNYQQHGLFTEEEIKRDLDESGVSVGKDRFEFVEKGW